MLIAQNIVSLPHKTSNQALKLTTIQLNRQQQKICYGIPRMDQADRPACPEQRKYFLPFRYLKRIFNHSTIKKSRLKGGFSVIPLGLILLLFQGFIFLSIP